MRKVSRFSSNSRTRQCLECCAAYALERHNSRTEDQRLKANERHRKWWHKNKELKKAEANKRRTERRRVDPEYRAKLQADRRKQYVKNPQKAIEYSRRFLLRKRYGMSFEDYEVMLAAQGNVCAICGGTQAAQRTCAGNVVVPKLSIDHDHKTGKVRGLLCHPCNQTIGKFGDSPERLILAAQYLSRYL